MKLTSDEIRENTQNYWGFGIFPSSGILGTITIFIAYFLVISRRISLVSGD
jgi:hypothetical protein